MDEKRKKPICEDCPYWNYSHTLTDENDDIYDTIGSCNIRSVNDVFPERSADEFCGEHPDFNAWLCEERGYNSGSGGNNAN